MNALKISKADSYGRNTAENVLLPGGNRHYKVYLLLVMLLAVWPIAQYVIMSADATIGFIDPNIWLLILLSLICFMIVTGLCWWLLQRFWMSMGLPAIGNMVLQFKDLLAWQQLGFYFASFVCLLLAAVGVLTAIL